MQIAALLRENKQPLMEGGNLSIGSHEAEHLDLKVTQRSYMVPKLNELLNSINRAFYAMHKAPLWSTETLKSGQFLSGSSLHFFNVAGIEDDTFYQKKPTVGDIDTMVDKRLEHILQTFLTEATNKKIGEATFLGFQKGNEQFSGLFELQDPPVKVQIDFEFVEFQNGAPTDWARFSHSSSWEDIQQGVKGVFHKWLIQSLTSLTRKPFLLRKMTGRGAMRKEEDVPMTDNMFSFAVSSKEGGGLRSKYEPVINPATNKPLMKGKLPVMKALPASGYEQDIGKIFTTILGKRLDPKTLKQVSQNFWSFTGLAQLINKIASPEDKQQILLGFLEKTIGKGSQGLYKNNPDKDIKEKTTAINYLVKTLGIKLPAEFTQMLSDYKANYKMTSLTEAGPNYKRQGIPHIYKPGSTVELKDADFIQLCTEIQSEGGKLEGVPINLKVDGAGIRFGKDEQGRPFFMTSKVTEPKYLENVGDFERYGQSIGQDPERLAFTKKYDDAMKAILTAPFMKVVPNDTIVQAEMMYTPMAQQEEGGLKFVNIAYDPSKLGKVMTLVPFMFKQFSTGQVRPDSAKIKEALLNSSNPNIKMVNNNLQHKGIDVSKIVAPVVKNADVLLRAVKERGMTPAKEKAKSVLNAARQQLSNAIINGPIPGKDQLGDTIEGLVVNMPSGLLVKVTSDAMANKMATKMAARQATPAGGQRPAVVAVGSAIGHVGHQQLFNYAIQLAQKVKGQPFMFIGPAEGKDDPIPPTVKVQTWHKLYPELANNISTVTQEGGSLLQKIKHELISPQPGKPPKFDTIYIVVGSDRQDMAENWSKTLMKAVNKFPGYENVKVSPYVTPRESSAGGTGISGTLLRNVLKDETKTPEQKFEVWNNAYNSGNYGAQKLPPEWIEYLMSIASKGMGMNQEQVREFFEKIKPLLKEASPEKQQATLQRLSELNLFKQEKKPVQKKDELGYKHLFKQSDEQKPTDEKRFHGWAEYEKTKNPEEVEESRIMDRNALINAYYVSTKGDRHKVAEKIPYYLLDKLVGLLTKKYNITMNDIEVRPYDKNQYRRTSQPELAEGTEIAQPGQLVTIIQAPRMLDLLPGETFEVRSSDENGVTLKHGMGTKFDNVIFPHGTYKVVNAQGLGETNVSKYKELGATKDTTHFIKNVTTGEIVSPHRSKQDAEDALVSYYRGPRDGNEYKIVRARKDVAEGIFGGLGGPASGPMLAKGGPGYTGLSGSKKLRHDAHVALQMVDSLKHTNHNGYYDEEIKKKLLQAQEYLAKAKELEQGLKEAGFDKEEFRRHMEQLRAREELRKTDPVSAKALDLRDELPQTVKKKPEDDSMSINDPRHPSYGALHNPSTGLEEVSDKTLVGYLKGVEADVQKHKSDPTKRSPEKANKSVKGFQTAFNKLDARKPDGSISEDYLDE